MINVMRLLWMVLVGFFLWYAVSTILMTYPLIKMRSETPAEHILWKVVKQTEDRYQVQADYQFLNYTGTTVFPETYWNAYVADEHLQANQAKSWIVHYNETHPEQNTLDYSFPQKQILYMVILWGCVLWMQWIIKRYFPV